jgi:hypothetical protein
MSGSHDSAIASLDTIHAMPPCGFADRFVARVAPRTRVVAPALLVATLVDDVCHARGLARTVAPAVPESYRAHLAELVETLTLVESELTRMAQTAARDDGGHGALASVFAAWMASIDPEDTERATLRACSRCAARRERSNGGKRPVAGRAARRGS